LLSLCKGIFPNPSKPILQSDWMQNEIQSPKPNFLASIQILLSYMNLHIPIITQKVIIARIILSAHALPRSQRNTDIPLLFNQLITVYFQLPMQWKLIAFIKHHMGKKIINVWCPASIALKNDFSIYFDTENGFSLGHGKHKNAILSFKTSTSGIWLKLNLGRYDFGIRYAPDKKYTERWSIKKSKHFLSNNQARKVLEMINDHPL